MSLKVLHITKETIWGAGIAAYRIHRALKESGVESRMLVSETYYDDDDIEVVSQGGINQNFQFNNRTLNRILKFMQRHGIFASQYVKMKLQKDKVSTKAYFTLPISTYDIANHPWIEWADVIHLHFVEDYLDYPSFFSKVKKPILWTIHDLNGIYGGFHHFRKYEQFAELYRPIEQACYDIKKHSIKNADNVSIVAISSKMHSLLSSHEFYNSKHIFNIHNCIDPSTYDILPQKLIREMLSIPQNAFVLMFSTMCFADAEKGLTEFIEAVNMLDIVNMQVICLGNGEIPACKYPVLHYQAVHDTIWISELYNAADCLVVASKQEAFPSTPLEAMCCGKPIVITPVSGADDMINSENGIIAKDFSSLALADAINMVYHTKYDGKVIRQGIIDNYAPNIIAKQYIDAYKTISVV